MGMTTADWEALTLLLLGFAVVWAGQKVLFLLFTDRPDVEAPAASPFRIWLDYTLKLRTVEAERDLEVARLTANVEVEKLRAQMRERAEMRS